VNKSKKKKHSIPPTSVLRGPVVRIPLPILLVVVLTAFLIYSPALNGPHIWDDELLIQDNPHVTSPGQIGLIFADDVEASGGEVGSLYRPLMTMTFAMDYGLWRMNPIGYHVVNVLWHSAVALLVFCFAFFLFGCMPPALIASLLFLVHPVQSEAVSYISGRSDPMSVFFLLGVFYLYIRRPFPRFVNVLALIVAYAACLLSRESGLILPALFLLYHGAFRKKMDRVSFAALLMVAAAYVAARLTVLDHLMPHAAAHGSWITRLPGFFAAYAHYLRLLVWPADLHMEYGTRVFSWAEPWVIGGLFLFLATTGVLVFAWKRSRLVALGLGWFLVSLIPVSNLFPINAYMAEHWLYLPSIGIFLLAAGGLYHLYQDPRLRKPSLALAAALVGFFGAMTFIHNSYWSDRIEFYERTFAYAPFSWRVANNLGTTYQEKGDLDKAEMYLLKAVALKDDNPETYNNLGVVYGKRDKSKEALAYFEKALSLDPQYFEVYRNMGNTHRRAGRPEEAAEGYHKALSLQPDYALAYSGLGNLAQDAGDFVEAQKLYQKALAIDPACVEAYNNLGVVKQKVGAEEVFGYYKEAIVRDPENTDAYANLALAYQQAGRHEEAAEVYERLFAIDPDHAAGLNNLGSLYQATGRIQEALTSYKKAIESYPESAEAYFNLGNAYRKSGRLQDAIEMYEKAAEFNPDSVDARVNLGATYQMNGQEDEAIKAYEDALEVGPSSIEAIMNLALIFQNRGEQEETQVYYAKAIAIDPGNGAVYNNMGMMSQGLGDPAAAEEMYRKAISVDPGFAQAYNNLAVLCMRSGRREEAYTALMRCVEADPAYAQGYHNLAIICLQRRDADPALRYLEKAKALGFTVDPRLEQDVRKAAQAAHP